MSQRPLNGPVPDPIGSASAQLFAAGVERGQRLLCLRFLGILLATADDEGHVHCDPDDLAGLGLLHGMTPEEVNRSRTLLETFGVLDRVPTGWSISHFHPVGDEVPPADVMAAIGRVLAKPGTEAPAPTPRQSEVVAMEPARERRARRWMAAPVGAGAAAALVLVALLVSGQVRVPLTSRPVSNSNQAAIGAGVTASTVPGESPASGSRPPSPLTAAPTASSVAQTPLGAPATDAPAPAQAVCPVGSVPATVDHMDQHIDSAVPSRTIAVDLPPVVRTTVSGTVRNNSPSAVDVNPFPVTVNFTDPSGNASETVTATALSGPTPIATAASIPWSVTVQNPKDAPVPGTANAAQPTWRWDDARLAAICTH